MKHCLLIMLLFAAAVLLAQPVSESAAYIYTKNDYGADFFNINNPITISKDGAVWCQPYTKPYIKIGNYKANTFLLQDGNYDHLQSVVKWNGKEILCTNEFILVFENQKLLKKFRLRNGWGHAFTLHQNGIYFLNKVQEKYSLYFFNGKNISLVRSFALPINTLVLHQFKNKLFLIASDGKQVLIYKVQNQKLIPLKKGTCSNVIHKIIDFKNINHFSFSNDQGQILEFSKGKTTLIRSLPFSYKWCGHRFFNTFIDNQKFISAYRDGKLHRVANTSLGDVIIQTAYSPESNSYYCGTGTSFMRLFPHIRKYPRLFFNSHSNSVFTLQQDSKGRIWAGSYQHTLSLIEDNNRKVVQAKRDDLMFLNGGIRIRDKMLLFAEGYKGIQLFSDIQSSRKLTESVQAFFAYASSDRKLYIGTFQKGIWCTPLADVEDGHPINWKKIARGEGLTIENTLTICEDQFANIWAAGSKAIAVYNPQTNTCKTWEQEKTKLPFIGALAILKDDRNTLWIGAREGSLIYYDGKSKTDFRTENFKQVKHPFFEQGQKITFLHQWKEFLIIGAGDKVLLFDLKQWHDSRQVLVRYLNPMEINLSTSTEQNTCFTDFRDNSFWFSSGDMVYQVDLEKWFSLPSFHVQPTILIQKDSVEIPYASNSRIEFEPTDNSFNVQINYQSKDNMSRFLNGTLVKKGEQPVFGQPNLQTKFNFANLSSGEYVFHVRICQQDGSFSMVQFPVTIRHFLWQNWWFWVLVSLIPLSFVFIYFRKQNQLEQQKKKLSQLNLSSLSNQFRPHFMLNALNSIGSQMDDMPHAEKVISRLGESISILYRFTQMNEFTHAFANEWKLVENIVEIQRLLFIPELTVEIVGSSIIPEGYHLPVGLIQIPAENALLHGLRNKTDRNCLLMITFKENEDEYFISIADNGIGRKKAEKINRSEKHGNGLKTVFEMIGIINQHQKSAIRFEIIDLPNESGTLVNITMNKNINYGKIRI